MSQTIEKRAKARPGVSSPRRDDATRPRRVHAAFGVGDVADRVTLLRAAATADRRRAQDEAWAWILGLGAASESETLQQLFELGRPPEGLNGPTDGVPVMSVSNPLIDLPVRQLARLWKPWEGKIFYADAGIGINRLSSSAIVPTRLLWPTYRVQRLPSGPAAFEFVSSAGPGRIAPRIPVLHIDYHPVRKNPRLIRRILDELVEVVPGTYLGRILFRLPAGRFANIGYFALRQPTA